MKIETLALEQARTLYNERLKRDFPPDELKPFSAIEAALREGRYACYGWCEGDDILAYAFFVTLGQWALLDYYAVRKDLRDTGLGSGFLKALVPGPLEGFDCALVEVEDPDAADNPDERARRDRRLRFYLRNGLAETGVRAVTFGVEYRVLTMPLGPKPDDEAVRRVYYELYRAVMSDAWCRRWVKASIPGTDHTLDHH